MANTECTCVITDMCSVHRNDCPVHGFAADEQQHNDNPTDRPRLDPAMRERVFEALDWSIKEYLELEASWKEGGDDEPAAWNRLQAEALEYLLAFLKEHC